MAEPPTPAWDPLTARAYLERRSQKWMTDRPCALSCHTTHPFLMADLVLPRRGAVSGELLERVEARTRLGDAAPVWYKKDALKIRQSRGTEAVLSAFAFLWRPGVEPKVAQAALDRLVAQQRPDGGFDWLDFGLVPWEVGTNPPHHASEITGAALAAIALAKARRRGDLTVPPKAVKALRQYLDARKKRPNHPTDPHNRLMIFWADETLGDILTDAERDALARDVMALQREDGGWSLGELGPFGRVHPSDGYATGLVVFLLAKSAVEVPEKSARLARARDWLMANQGEDGAWAGMSYNKDRDFNHGLFTDASTAFAVLALDKLDAVTP